MAYATLAEVRATSGLDDTTAYPDAMLNEAIAWAELRIDRITATSWTYKSFSVTVDGTGRRDVNLRDDEGRPVLFPRTLSAVTINGVSVSTTGWALHPSGRIVRPIGDYFDRDDNGVGRNVAVSGTAGIASACPSDIAWACRTLARQYALDLVSRVPDRAMSIVNDYGNVSLAQASAHPDKPTSLPEVNAVLIARRQWHPSGIA